jgi:MFS-type transporter involved in bile tolerance (Atg22 family)
VQVLPYVVLTVVAKAVAHAQAWCWSCVTDLFAQKCVIYNGADYVVVHKPAGVQVAPTVDNLLENVLFCAAQVSQAAFTRSYLEAHVPLVHAKGAFSALVSCLIEKTTPFGIDVMRSQVLIRAAQDLA